MCDTHSVTDAAKTPEPVGRTGLVVPMPPGELFEYHFNHPVMLFYNVWVYWHLPDLTFLWTWPILRSLLTGINCAVQQINRTLKDSENLPKVFIKRNFFNSTERNLSLLPLRQCLVLYFIHVSFPWQMVNISCQPPVTLKFLCLCIVQNKAWLATLDISQLLM